MKPSGNKYGRLFKLAGYLRMSHDNLRDCAAGYSGQPSLRSLSDAQLQDLYQKLWLQWQGIRAKRLAMQENGFKPGPGVTPAQAKFMVDLISVVFTSLEDFRKWLGNYFTKGTVTHERHLDRYGASRVLKALTEMRNRGYKANATETHRNRQPNS